MRQRGRKRASRQGVGSGGSGDTRRHVRRKAFYPRKCTVRTSLYVRPCVSSLYAWQHAELAVGHRTTRRDGSCQHAVFSAMYRYIYIYINTYILIDARVRVCACVHAASAWSFICEGDKLSLYDKSNPMITLLFRLRLLRLLQLHNVRYMQYIIRNNDSSLTFDRVHCTHHCMLACFKMRVERQLVRSDKKIK